MVQLGEQAKGIRDGCPPYCAYPIRDDNGAILRPVRPAHAAVAAALQRLPDLARQARPDGRTTTEIRRKYGVGTERVSALP